MIYCLPSAAKLNLTLRVIGRREDGYHELRSLFYRLSPVETLTIETDYGHNVKNKINVTGLQIKGRNILEDVLELAATRGKFPPLRLRLHKEVPPGSGLGGGSGNAATLISWLNLFLSEENSLRGEEVGSDVPFFLEGGKWAQVGGRGEDVQRLPYNPPHYHVVVAIPSWSMSTRRAFSLLAARFGSSRLMSEDQAEMERDDVMGKLGACRHYGLLPNDFAPFLMEAHPEYNDLFRTFDEGGALAWGITGSGGAAFSFFIDGDECARTAAVLGGIGWIKKILILE